MCHDQSEEHLAGKHPDYHGWEDAEEPMSCEQDRHVGDNVKKVLMEDFYGADLHELLNVSDSSSSYFGSQVQRKRASARLTLANANSLIRKMT